MLLFAESLKLTTGSNPNRKFINYPEVRYSSLKFTKQCNENPELRKALFDTVVPFLDGLLSDASELDNLGMSEEEVFEALNRSMERTEGIVLTEMSTKVEELDKLDMDELNPVM